MEREEGVRITVLALAVGNLEQTDCLLQSVSKHTLALTLRVPQGLLQSQSLMEHVLANALTQLYYWSCSQ